MIQIGGTDIFDAKLTLRMSDALTGIGVLADPGSQPAAILDFTDLFVEASSIELEHRLADAERLQLCCKRDASAGISAGGIA